MSKRLFSLLSRATLHRSGSRFHSAILRSTSSLSASFQKHPYSTWQLSMASFLLVVFLIGQTVSVPLFDRLFADAPDRPNLLSILVNEAEFEGEIRSAIVKYARSVEAVHSDIRTLIVPISRTLKVHQIAGIQEKLYYEGDGKSEARLAYTLLVGDIPLPVVASDEGVGVSIYPYVDFRDKKFRYDSTSFRYTLNPDVSQGYPEVGHGVLRPHSGDRDKDRQGIVDYFAKLDEFYSKKQRFSNIDTSEPRVLVVNNVEDAKSFSPLQYSSYLLRQKWREDLSYRRYTADWSRQINDTLNAKRSSSLIQTDFEKQTQKDAIVKQLADNPEFRSSLASVLGYTPSGNISDADIAKIIAATSSSVSRIPDIQSGRMIEKSLSHFVELFGSRSISEREGFVYRLGRYLSADDKLLLDSVPIAATSADNLANGIIKNANDTITEALTPYFQDLAVPAPILTEYTHAQRRDQNDVTYSPDWFTYDNYFAGKKASDITTAQDCSLIRGSTQTVMASKGFDFAQANAVGNDIEVLTAQPRGDACVGTNMETSGFWGNHSFLNYDQSTNSLSRNGKVASFSGFTKSVFALAGSKKVDASQYKYDPSSCLVRDLIARPAYYMESGFRYNNRVNYPQGTNGDRYTCQPNKVMSDPAIISRIGYKNFVLRDVPFSGSCDVWSASLSLSGSEIASMNGGSQCSASDNRDWYDNSNYYQAKFRLVPSLILQNSPTIEEEKLIRANGATPNIAIDKVHQFAYLLPNLETARFTLPNLFQIGVIPGDSRESIRTKLQLYINKKQQELNALRSSGDPSLISADAKKVYDTLKDSYPSDTPNLSDVIFRDEKLLNSIVSSLYWMSHGDIETQYDYTFRNLLDGNQQSFDPNDVFQKGIFGKQQEVALINSAAQDGNMSISFPRADEDALKLSDEDIKSQSGISRILSAKNALGSLDVAVRKNESSVSGSPACSPMGDAVEITKWPAALQCWIDTELKVEITPGACSARTVGKLQTLDLREQDSAPPSVSEVNSSGEKLVLSSVLSDVGVRGTYQIVTTRVNSEGVIMQQATNDLYSLRVDTIRDTLTNKDIYRHNREKKEVLSSYLSYQDSAYILRNGEGSRAFTPKRANAEYTFSLIRESDGAPLTAYTLRVRSEGIDTKSMKTSLRANEKIDLSSLTYYGKSGVPESVRMSIYNAINGNFVSSGSYTASAGALDIAAFKKSGSYTVVLRSPSGESAIFLLTVIASEANRLELKSPSAYFIKNAPTPVIVRPLDSEGNISLNATVVVELENATFLKGNAKQEFVTSGPLSLSLLPKGNPSEIKIKAYLVGQSASISYVMKNPEDLSVELEIKDRASLIVGGDPILVRAVIKSRSSGGAISDYHGAISLHAEGVLLSDSVSRLNRGVSPWIKVTPRTQSREGGSLRLGVTGIGLSREFPLPISPETPLFVHVQEVSSESDTSHIEVSLRDVYGNVAYQKSGESIDLSLESTNSGSTQEAQFLENRSKTYKLSELGQGFALWKVDISNIRPGVRAIVRAKSSRNLETKSYTIQTSQASDKEIIFGVSNAHLLISRGAMVTPEDIHTLNPSFLYGFLTGDAFSNQDAGETISDALIFDRESRTLAVTAYTSRGGSQRVGSISPTGKPYLTNLGTSSSEVVSQLSDGFLSYDIVNRLSRIAMTRVTLPKKNRVFTVCEGDLSTCIPPAADDSTLVSRNDSSLAMAVASDVLTISRDSTVLLRAYANGSYEAAPGISLSVKTESASPLLQVGVMEGGTQLATLLLIHKNSSVLLYNPKEPSDQTRVNNSFVVSALDSRSTLSSGYVGAQTRANLGVNIDDSSVVMKANRPWSEDDLSSTLPQDIAGGARIGDALLSPRLSVFLLNSGDPLFSLRPLDREATYDLTIGSRLYESGDDQLLQALPFDFEGDGFEDIVLVHKSGILKLLKNTGGSLRNVGIFARLPQAQLTSLRSIRTKNGGSHIVFIDDTGHISLYINTGGRLSASPVLLFDRGSSESRRFEQIVSQLEVYDMDRDGRDDVIALDNEGTIHVLSLRGDRVAFDANRIDSGLVLKIENGEDITGIAVADKRIILPIPDAGNALQNKIRNELYGEITITEGTESSVTSLSDTSYSVTNADKTPYVRGDHAPVEGLIVQKMISGSGSNTVANLSSLTSKSTVKNATTIERSIRVLDRLPKTVSPSSQEYEWRVIRPNGDTGVLAKRSWSALSDTSYDRISHEVLLQPGDTLEINSLLPLKKIKLKSLFVGNLDGDEFGEIGYNTSESCGSAGVMFDQSSARIYTKIYTSGNVATSSNVEFREDISSLIDESKKQGGATSEQSRTTLANLAQKYRDSEQEDLDRDENKFMSIDPSTNTLRINGPISDEEVEEINQKAEDIVQQFSCGYGAQGCFNTPINWAPLAPGSAPRGFGLSFPALLVQSAPPAFAVPTTLPTPFGPIPFIWPGSPWGAGGMFGDVAPFFSQFRMYVTPTLTGSMGAAFCFGGPSAAVGNLNPLYPFIPAGNCIVTAKPLAACSKSGSSGDVSKLGASAQGGQSDGFYNGNACIVADTTSSSSIRNAAESQGYNISVSSVSELGNKKSIPSTLLTTGKTTTGPLFSLGGSSVSDDALDVSIDPLAISEFRFNDIVKVKNIRVAAFPDFIMDWVNRQMEEVQTKLTTLPSIYIILPDMNAFSDLSPSTLSSLPSSFTGAYNQSIAKLSGENTLQGSGNYAKLSQAGKTFENSIQSGLSGVESVYTFLGSLPFLSIDEEHIPVTYPVINDREIQLAIREWTEFGKKLKETTLAVYKKLPKESRDLTNLLKKSQEIGMDKLTEEERFYLNSAPFIASVEANLAAIEAYQKLPEQLQKYLTWKEKYAGEILCNIEQIEQITGGFIADNGIRFQKWAEAVAIIRAIFNSWQIIIDLFDSFETECGSCVNERYDLKYFIIKLISVLIPQIPIIQFPKWPDIILDIHNIRLGVTIVMPIIDLNPQPLSLPRPPKIIWPDLGNIDLGSFSLTLPAVPLVIPAPPTLPDLPDIPSLPSVKLPMLPPPPKIPNLFGLAGLGSVLNILKMVSKMLCVLRNLPIVPENQAGERIAQLTDRKGFNPLDFISLDLPNIPITSIDAIKVTSYINYEYKTDIIAKFVREQLEPLNNIGLRASESLNRDLSKLQPDTVDLNKQVPKDLREGMEKINENTSNDVDLNSVINDRINFLIPIIEGASQEITAIHQKALSQSGIRLTSDEFLSQTKRDLPRVIRDIDNPLISDKLSKIYAELESDIAHIRADRSIEDGLALANKQKHEGIRTYIKASLKEDALLKETIHTIREDASKDILAHQSYLTPVSGVANARSTALASYRDAQSKRMAVVTNALFSSFESSQTNIVHAAPGAKSSTMSDLVTVGDPSAYPGLYYRSGDAQRLFTTATNHLTKESRIISFALTNDVSRKDVIYINNGVLYLKTSKGTPTSIFAGSTAPDITRVDELFPDGFSSHMTPDFLALSALKGRDLRLSFDGDTSPNSLYRLDYNSYHPSLRERSSGGSSTQGMILIAESGSPIGLSSMTGVTQAGVSIASESRGAARITLPERQYLAQGQSFTLTPGKRIFTSRSTRLSVRPLSGGETKLLTLATGDTYMVSEDTFVTLLTGEVGLIGDSLVSQEVADISLLAGTLLPIGSRIDMLEPSARLAIKIIGSPDSGPQIATLNGISRFDMLASESDEGRVEVVLREPPALAYATISDILDPRTTRTAPLLISSAKSSQYDPLSPLTYTKRALLNETSEIRLSDEILLPSLAEKIISLEGDPVLSSRLEFNESAQKIIVRPFSTLGNYDATLKIALRDGLLLPIKLKIIVEAPVPSIREVLESPAVIRGDIDYPRSGIPIDIMRSRGMGLKHLNKTIAVATSSSGSFVYEYDANKKDTLVLAISGTTVALIDEMSGIVTAKDPRVSLTVMDSGLDMPSSIDVSYGDLPLARLAIRLDASTLDRPVVSIGVGETASSGSLSLERLANTLSGYSGSLSLDFQSSSGSGLRGGYILRTSEGLPLFAFSREGQFARLQPGFSYRVDSTSTDHLVVVLREDSAGDILKIHYPQKLYSRFY